ncbi:MAG: nucleotide pyrophosphohydrolase [Bacteroides sp.]|nr:nucleotide pyrophosphohydrolase [Bacteroides sp.]
MTLRRAQQTVDDWIRTIGVRYFSPLTNMAVLTEEVGEVARVMARRYGDQSAKPGDSLDLADELADVLWVVMAIANQTGVDLTDALARNIVKKTARDATRHRDNPKLSTPERT